jgi:hypothetical protein
MDSQNTPQNQIDALLAYGNDESPWMNSVPEAPPSHWGKVMTDRSRSEAYAKFLLSAKKKNEENNGRR